MQYQWHFIVHFTLPMQAFIEAIMTPAKKKHTVEIEGGIPPFVKGKYSVEWETESKKENSTASLRVVKSVELNMRLRPDIIQLFLSSNKNK